MPNWSWSTVTVHTGSKVTLAEFEKDVVVTDPEHEDFEHVNINNLFKLNPYIIPSVMTNEFSSDAAPEHKEYMPFSSTTKDNAVFHTETDPEKIEMLAKILMSNSTGPDLMMKPTWTKKDFGKVRNILKRLGIHSWYDWNCANLGTKWNFEIQDLEENDGCITFFTQTAWSPPEAFCQMLANKYGVQVDVSYTVDGESEWNHTEWCAQATSDNCECEDECECDPSCEWEEDGVHGCTEEKWELRLHPEGDEDE